ncbi:hypothetical protein [Hymenobacter arizonensis]|uniref:Uncharacterized protein n=1 Tax=Hymenobacter arizonensis TaxID=1227077 RepID=A0A1I5Y5B9_HYMAR|nr:hypothetical protein [Hymenobacter arizonensis]SFQ39127.1 hypothetical protein SAMN04515668_2221 [Hymenobacter arizonensis]
MLSDSDVRPDAALLAMRPSVPTATVEPGTVGAFLHTTLRPVLKMQNMLLLAIVADFVLDHHIPLAKASGTDQQRLLAELLGRNTKLRYTVVGLVSGVFSAGEYIFYRQHRSELNRRMLELVQQRVLDQTALVLTLANDSAAL